MQLNSQRVLSFCASVGLCLTSALLPFDALALKKAPPKPGWQACGVGASPQSEFDAVPKAVMRACLDLSAQRAVDNVGSAVMYCKNGQYTCCEVGNDERIESCSSVGGSPQAVVVPKSTLADRVTSGNPGNMQTQSAPPNGNSAVTTSPVAPKTKTP